MENHRRKNGRLLLCLLTVFMMVSTGFAAFVSASDWNAAEPTSAGELGSEPREIGKQPISASEESTVIQETSNSGAPLGREVLGSSVAADNGIKAPNKVWSNAQEALKQNVEDEEQRIPIDQELPDDTASPDLAPKPITSSGSMFNNAIPNIEETQNNKGTGTMGSGGPTPQVVTIDANGPYGTMIDPYYEGQDVDFYGSMSGGNEDDYQWMWDFLSDGTFTTGWMDDPDTSVLMTDNAVGDATLIAWDELNPWLYTPHTGEYWNGAGPTWLYYVYGYPASTIGWSFTVNEDTTVDQVGMYRYWDASRGYCPRYFYNVRLWTSSGGLLAEAPGPFYPSANSWMWVPISSTPMTAGNDYVISAYIRTASYPSYYMPSLEFTGPTADGVIEPINYRYGYGNSYPPYQRSTTVGPLLDFQYQWTEAVMNTVTDTAGIYVDNVDPVIETMDVSPAVVPEGTEVTLTATMTDEGVDDTWRYRACWGDAPYPEDCDPWTSVEKYGGGANILMTASYSEYEWNAMIPMLQSHLGVFAKRIDIFDVYEEQEVPPLDLLLQYDVVVAGENYFIYDLADPYGDVLKEYSDLGGNVVTSWVSDMDDYYYGEGGILGAWRDDGYYIFDPDDLYFGWSNLGTIYDPTHPVFSGVGGVSTYYSYWSSSVTPGTTVLADMNPYSRPFIGVKDNPAGSGGCISGIAMLPHDWANTGDWVELFGNLIKWCSQQPEPYNLPQPLVFSASHMYKDDHPTHVTPVDMKNVKVELKDDDHEKCVLNCASYVVINEASLSIDWLEIYNFGTSEVDMTGWEVIFYDNRGYTPNLYTFPSFILGPGASVVLHEYSGTNTAEDLYVGFNIWWVEYTPYGGGAVLLPTAASGFDCDFVRWNSGYTNPACAWGPPDFNQDVIVYRAVDEDTDTGADWDTGSTGTENALNPGQTGAWPQPPDAVLLSGYDEDTTDVAVENVFPTANPAPGVFTPITNEMSVISFGQDKDLFSFNDPALREETETFWWRWDTGDGAPLTQWEETWQIIPGAVGGNTMVTGVPMDFPVIYDYSEDGAQQLLHNFLITGMPSGEGTILLEDTSWFMFNGDDALWENTMNGNFGTNWDFVYDASGTDLLDAGGALLYDALIFSYDWAYEGPNYNADQLLEFVDAGGHLMITGDEFDYGVLDFLPWFVEYSGFDPYTQFPGPAFPGTDPWSTDVATGEWGFNYELHNTIDDFDDTVFIPIFADPDPITTLVRVGEARWPKNAVWPFQHVYGDNGIYTTDLQIIDDDMNWEFTSGYPVYVGPAGEEDMWISHNYFDVEVYNTDPVIADVDVYVEGDLCLRLSGNKGNEATLMVNDGYGGYQELTLIRDPNNPEFGCLEDLKISLKKADGASIKIAYVPSDDDGSNPSWLVEGYWPGDDPHKVHVVFDAKKGPQVKTISMADMFLGVPINFEVSAGDLGSDDLAFVWNWGDVTPHGVNLYANAGGGAVAGFSDESQRLFDQLPNRDPWFDRPANKIKSPLGNSIAVTDLQQHAYEDPYYYYAMVTVLDDDTGDGYPSPYATDGVDMEFFELNLV